MKRRQVLQVVVAIVLLQSVGLLQQPGALAQVFDVGGGPESSTFGRKKYSPYLHENIPQRVFWSDTPHTTYSTDSGLLGTRLGPSPDANNLHRVVVCQDDEETVGRILPFSAFGSLNSEDLWAWTARYEEKTGGQVSAISFNGSLSIGRMFAVEDPDGKPATLGFSREPTKAALAQHVTIAGCSTPTRPVRTEDDLIAGDSAPRELEDAIDEEHSYPLVPAWHEESEPESKPEPERWSSFLPFWGKELREAGYELPLPLGFSVAYSRVKRDIDVDDIKLRINGGSKVSVKQFLQVEADSTVDVAIARFDAWILPFLNVYTYTGWQWNESNIKIDVNVPLDPLPPLQFTIKDDGRLDGPFYGAGLMLAVGYENFFATSNVDLVHAEFDEFDSDFDGWIWGMRVGWDGECFEVPLRLWTGAMYFGTETTIESKINVPGVGRVKFEVEQGPENPWNAILGMNLGIHESIELVFEYGFNFEDVSVLVANVTYRF